MGYMFWIMCDLFCFRNGEDYLLFPNYLVVTISYNKDTLSQLDFNITGIHYKICIIKDIDKLMSSNILFLSGYLVI